MVNFVNNEPNVIFIHYKLQTPKKIEKFMVSGGKIEGIIIDPLNKRMFPGTVAFAGGKITSVTPLEGPAGDQKKGRYILPGLIDSHIHIESSMLTPYEFARMALTHGTVATVSDPHEIANVCGMDGVYYMLENAREARLKFHFGAPSCVPATTFESAGAVLNADDVDTLMRRNDIYYLSEMMNYPGVLFHDPEVMAKIKIAHNHGKPVDGHAPGLMGEQAVQYINAGISTDHECFTKEEALHKLKHGMKILIREGSAARNFEALHELISEYPDKVMLCSDDKHPDELIHGHINLLVKRALLKGHQLMDILQCACVNPVIHYNLRSGLLRENDPADFIVINDPQQFNVLSVFIDGEEVASNGKCILPKKSHSVINSFSVHPKQPKDFTIASSSDKIQVIEAVDGQLVTNGIVTNVKAESGMAVSDTDNDILKLTVVNRYRDEKPSIAFIKNFNLKKGAIASTVAHDSHNIIAVGADDESIAKAVNLLIANEGGLSVFDGKEELVLALPVGGLMSTLSCEETGALYSAIDQKVKEMGCTLRAPYMTLSFMALLVIPSLKLSDKGLFDGNSFKFTDVFV
jgi:adenine deaminase